MPNKKLNDALLAIATLSDKEQYALFIALREVFDPNYWLKPWEDAHADAALATEALRLRVQSKLDSKSFVKTGFQGGGVNFRQWLQIYGLTEDSDKTASAQPNPHRKRAK